MIVFHDRLVRQSLMLYEEQFRLSITRNFNQPKAVNMEIALCLILDTNWNDLALTCLT